MFRVRVPLSSWLSVCLSVGSCSFIVPSFWFSDSWMSLFVDEQPTSKTSPLGSPTARKNTLFAPKLVLGSKVNPPNKLSTEIRPPQRPPARPKIPWGRPSPCGSLASLSSRCSLQSLPSLVSPTSQTPPAPKLRSLPNLPCGFVRNLAMAQVH